MPSSRQQQTIAGPASVAGFGYWTGRDVSVEFRPAPVDAGVTFVRRDLGRSARIHATIANRIEAVRRTSLRHGDATVEMIEHVMAALSGLRIDNCEVWVSSAEMPGCDGSAKAFVDALDRVGIVSQDAARQRLVVDQTVRFGDSDKWIEVQPPQGDGMSVAFEIDYGPTTSIGRQSIRMAVLPESFRREIAGSRTFLLEEEARSMIAQGLGTRVTPGDLLIFGPDGPIGNQLRFPDECVRHKVLDVVGDLALAGVDVVAHVVAYRSGHQLNGEVARWLSDRARSVASATVEQEDRQCA